MLPRAVETPTVLYSLPGRPKGKGERQQDENCEAHFRTYPSEGYAQRYAHSQIEDDSIREQETKTQRL